MQLWLNPTGEVSLREQIITQVVLGILCRELTPDERLPSTRELARRFGVHANTASRAYRQLERDGWLEFRHGSGVFVRTIGTPIPSDLGLPVQDAMQFAVDQLIGEMNRKAIQLGASPALLHERLRQWLVAEPAQRWLVVDPDPELRQILVFEMQQALQLPVSGCAPEECVTQTALARALPVARPSKAESVRQMLSAQTELITLEIRPVTPSIKKYLPQAGGGLIGVASRWQDFLRISNTLLIASGVAPESLVIRDATRPGWKRGLEHCYAILCDAAIRDHLPEVQHRVAFRLLDEPSIARLRKIEDGLRAATAGTNG
jgi:DNA-binding transcriptional regulator YhcF (GntR family)